MAKFYGMIGFSVMTETKPGVIQECIEEHPYYGDIVRRQAKWDARDVLNDDMNVANDVSIVADAFAYNHFHDIRYVVMGGGKWKVRSITVDRPRLTLSIGGVYNEQLVSN